MIGAGVGSLAGGYISEEKLGGSYELGAFVGNLVGGVAGSAAYSKISRSMAAKVSENIGAPKASEQLLLTNNKKYMFAGDEAIQHFDRHGKEVMDALGKKSYNLKNYFDDANYIVKNGQYVSELNGYVKILGGKGTVKTAFVGMKNGGANISTFHIKSARQIAKKAPSLGWHFN